MCAHLDAYLCDSEILYREILTGTQSVIPILAIGSTRGHVLVRVHQ